MNSTQPLLSLHQLLDSAITLDESLQRAIRQIRTLNIIDLPGNPNSATYATVATLTHLLMACIALTVTVQLLTKQGVGNVSS